MPENKNNPDAESCEQEAVFANFSNSVNVADGDPKPENMDYHLGRTRNRFWRTLGMATLPVAVAIGSSLSFRSPEGKASPPSLPACHDRFDPESGDITLSSPDNPEGCRYLSMVINRGSFFLARDSVVTIKANGREVTVAKGKMLFAPPVRSAVEVVMNPIRISPEGWMELRKEAEKIVVISGHEGLKIKSLHETFVLNQGEMAVYDNKGTLIYRDKGKNSRPAGLSCSSFESFSGGEDEWMKLLLILSLLIAGGVLARKE